MTFIMNFLSRKFLAVPEASRVSGAKLIQWNYSDDGSQDWSFEQVSPNTYKIRNRRSGKLIDVPGSSQRRGTQLIQWDDNGANSQLWVMGVITDSPHAPEARYFRNFATNQIIDVEGASRNDGDHIIQWPLSGGVRGNQQWQVTNNPILGLPGG
jgi:hypothetical protein